MQAKPKVTEVDVWNAYNNHMATLKTDEQRRAFVEALRRRFRWRYEQKLKAAMSKPTPDLNEIRRWKEAIVENEQC
jgi:hypothetical protein